MTVRLFASLVLIGCAWGIGQSKAYALRLRGRRITRLIGGLRCMENEVRCLCAPLPQALLRAADFDPLFKAAADKMILLSAADAFAAAVRESSVPREEERALLDFAAGLFAEDSMGQLRNMEACRARLESILQTANADTARLGRLYGAGGAAMGLLLVILLI